MPPPPEFATDWGATHHHSDLRGPVHWIHWAGPREAAQREPMVLIHGLGGNVVNWLDCGRILSAEAEVFALDLRGFGLTPGVLGGTSVLANRDVVVAFLEHVVRRPATLVGNSMGGMIATFVARARPDLAARLILIDPALPPQPGVLPDPVVASRFALFAIPGLAERALRRVRERVPPARVIQDMAALVYADPSRHSADIATVAMAVLAERAASTRYGDLDRSFTQAARSLMRIVAQPGRYRDHLQGLDCPVLLIHGDRDRLVNVAAARRAARDNPIWSYVEFSGVGHVPQMEVPAATATSISHWLTRSSVAV